MEAKLIVVGGDVKASEISLKLPTIIGRGKGATLLLQHALVSRQHCEIYEHDGQLVVRDMGSLNGTYVNNSRLTEPTLLPSGDLLTIGDVTFRAEYFVDPNLQPPEGPKTARIGGLPTSQAVKAPVIKAPTSKAPAGKAPPTPVVPDFAAMIEDDEDDEEVVEVDFGSVEEVEEVAEVEEEVVGPKLKSLDDIPAVAANSDNFANDMLAVLDVEEVVETPPAKLPAPKPPEKKPAAPVIGPPPAKETAPAKTPPIKTGGKAGGSGAKQPSNRWSLPTADSNETLRAPGKPKSPPSAGPSAQREEGGVAVQEPVKSAATPHIGPPPEANGTAHDEAADFLAVLGRAEAPPTAEAAAPPSAAETPSSPEVEEVADIDVVEMLDADEPGTMLETEDHTQTITDDVESAALLPPALLAEAAGAVEAPLSVEATPSIEFESEMAAPSMPPDSLSDDDISALLATTPASEDPLAVDVEVEDVVEAEAEPAPVPLPPPAPVKRPHAIPTAMPFAMPYAPQQPVRNVAPAAPVPPPPLLRPRVEPMPRRALPGQLAPPTTTSPAQSDADLSDFLKNLGK